MDRQQWITGLLLAGVLLLAVGFRFYDIQNYPPGIFPDEAANGEDVLLILNGDLRPFYERGNGREALFFYLQAALVKLFGIGVWPMHAAAGIIGTLTVLATYFGTRLYFGRAAGLLAALFLATNHWHVTLSRTGFRAIMVPLCLAAFTAFVAFTVKAVKQGQLQLSYLYAAAAGAAFMAGFYTYIAYRVMVGVVLGILLLLAIAALHPKIGFPHWRRYGRQLAVAAAAALIVFAPLGWYFIAHPQAFVGRAGQVSVFNPDLQVPGGIVPTVLRVTEKTLLSFFTMGDDNWRHNVAGWPLLNPLVGLLFLLGLAWVIQGTLDELLRIGRGQEIHLGMIYPYILLLLAGMLLPVITTAEGIPHGLRSLGLLFPIFFTAGTAGSVTLYWIKRRLSPPPVRSAIFGLAAGLVMLGIVYDGSLYFLIARRDAQAHYAYRGDLTEVASFINAQRLARPDQPRPYLVLDKFSLQTVHYLASVAAHDYHDHLDAAEHKYQDVDPATSHLTPLAPGQMIIFTQSTIPDADRFQQVHGSAIELIELRRNQFGQEIMRIYQAPFVDA